MGIDAKTSKILSQTYFIVSGCFILFGLGLFGNTFVHIGISWLLSLVGTITGLFMFCTESPKLKAYFISIGALGLGFGAGAYCTYRGLDNSEITFCALATALTFVSATLASLVTRELTLLYISVATLFLFAYIPLSIYYIFSWGFTSLYLLLSLGLVISVICLMIDTHKIILSIEGGVIDPFILSWILFEDVYDLFMNIAKVMIVNKKKDDD
ncbi:hypothetical protein EDI_260820 [Entamoeba dispar SAW760]|uniref:Bax inhibitor n=1 Tax=Entamoeba dispar (strain ATCC PRA-260 / SAW760) TaxID=370354 RepID=B0EIW8_ENTDS|nr:uncharacterized protein EDI_260820 [Entamoeba dispar SAW760]EDR25536.1 hypothetical protein EDI_260820 [Entamoeba dispar SAW760]|eukprot:EDR25536.1 hypothetical protein EDI_260820 [Entamoeba dispar SAW760]